MADLAKLGVEVTGKGITNVRRDLDGLATSAKKTESGANKLAGAFAGLKVAATAFVGALAIREVAQLGATFVKAASDAAETQNKFSVVFGSIRDEAERTSDVLEKSYGMSDKAAKESLSAVGDLLTGLGLQQKVALDLASQTVKLGTDLASFTNYVGGAQGATEALTKAMLGETEMAKSLGLVLNETQMDAYATSVGKTWKELNIAEKAQLRLNAAIAQSPNAVGDFARSSKELANQMRIADAIISDVSVNLGTSLKPAVLANVQAFTGMREELDLASQTFSGFLLQEVSGASSTLRDFTDFLLGSSKNADRMSVALMQVAGQLKIIGNVAQLAINPFVSLLNTAYTVGGQLREVFSGLGNAMLGNFSAAQKAFENFNKIGLKGLKEEIERYKTDFKDIQIGYEMTVDPSKMVAQYRKAFEEIKKGADTAAKATSKAVQGDTGPTVSAKVLKDQKLALSEINDKLAELTLSEQAYAEYRINKWYDSKAAVVGYTSELEKARQLEIAESKKGFADKDKEKKAQIQDEINRAILASDTATAQQREAIVKSQYAARIEAAKEYGISTVALEEERSQKIQAIWEEDARKHGSMIDGISAGLKKFSDEAGTAFERGETAGLAMARSLETELGSMLSVTGKGFEDWGNKAINIVNSVLDAVVQASIVKPLAGAISGGLSGMFTASANGNVFSGGDISAYSGTVVSKPTFFSGSQNKAYAKGGNVMGEAGPEAILPLTRTSGGKLGVEAVNGRGGGDLIVNVSVENNTRNAQASVQQQPNDSGGLDLVVMIDEMTARNINRSGSRTSQALQKSYGARPVLAGR